MEMNRDRTTTLTNFVSLIIRYTHTTNDAHLHMKKFAIVIKQISLVCNIRKFLLRKNLQLFYYKSFRHIQECVVSEE